MPYVLTITPHSQTPNTQRRNRKTAGSNGNPGPGFLKGRHEIFLNHKWKLEIGNCWKQYHIRWTVSTGDSKTTIGTDNPSFFDRTQGDRGQVKIKEIVEMGNENEMTQVTQVTQKIKQEGNHGQHPTSRSCPFHHRENTYREPMGERHSRTKWANRKKRGGGIKKDVRKKK